MKKLFIAIAISIWPNISSAKVFGLIIQGDSLANYNDHFWIDAVEFYNWLIKGGVAAEDIYVLCGNGTNWGATQEYLRPEFRVEMVDTRADYFHIDSITAYLATITTPTDILIFATINHGGTNGDTANLHSTLRLVDYTEIWDTTLARMIKRIPCAIRYGSGHQCYSGGFCDDFADSQSIFLASTGPRQWANGWSDDRIKPGDTVTPYSENGLWNGYRQYQSEVMFHFITAAYGGTNPSYYFPDYFYLDSIDTNNDKEISAQEQMNWILIRESIPNGQDPMFTDIGNNADKLIVWPQIRFNGNVVNKESNNKPLIRLYPNPSKGIIYIEENVGVTITTTLYDASGRLILKTDQKKIGGLKSGIYFYQIEADDQKITGSITVNK